MITDKQLNEWQAMSDAALAAEEKGAEGTAEEYESIERYERWACESLPATIAEIRRLRATEKRQNELIESLTEALRERNDFIADGISKGGDALIPSDD